jgi:hypothetical protein
MRGSGSSSRHSSTRPDVRVAGLVEEHRRAGATTRLGVGSVACPACDAPVSVGSAPVSPAAAAFCPFCGATGALRDFLSLAQPTRPARVVIEVRRRRAA